MRPRNFPVALTGLLFGATLTAPLHGQTRPVITSQADAAESVTFEVLIPQQHRAELDALLTDLTNPASVNYHHWLKPAEVQARFGTDPARITAIARDFGNYGLTSTVITSHVIRVSGTASAVQSALSTRLFHGINAKGKQVLVASGISAPASLQGAGAVVSGLSGVTRMHHSTQKQAEPDNRYSPEGPYWFTDLKQAYSWPSYKALNGAGTTIAVLMSGGYSQADMNLYFNHEGIASPSFSEVNVDGGSPYNPTDGGTVEAALDMQQTGGMAPAASIVLYSIPDLSDQSIVDGLTQIIIDNKADVVNMSFGGSELAYTPVYNDGESFLSIPRFIDDLFAEGNAQGITFVASSGDSGALNIPAPACFFTNNNPCGTFFASANFPASSPHVTGVGGTNLQTTYSPGSLRSAYVLEDAYADPLTEDIFYGTFATGGYWGSGGGDSVVFSKPSYQSLVTTGSKQRTVPDLSLHMGGCPNHAICTGHESADAVAVGGSFFGVIGTSASSPDFAGLTALNVEQSGSRFGNENFYIYTLASLQKSGTLGFKVFHQGIPGFNGFYTSGNEGYNRVLGNGTLYGKDFLLAPAVTSAGDPGTPSNP